MVQWRAFLTYNQEILGLIPRFGKRLGAGSLPQPLFTQQQIAMWEYIDCCGSYLGGKED